MAAVGGSAGFGSKPRALVCHICGREFGTKSLAIHIKACTKKWEDAEAQKPPRERRPVPQVPQAAVDVPIGASNADLDRRNEVAMAAFEEQAMMQCEHCGRTFLAERLPVHQRSCTAEHPARAINGKGGPAEETKAATIAAPRSPMRPEPKAGGSPPMAKSLKPGVQRPSPSQTSPAKPGAATAGLAKFCPSCGAKYGDADRFCGQCGTTRP